MTDHAHTGFPQPPAPEAKAPPRTNLLYSEKFRAIIYQVVLIGVVIGVGFFLVSNTLTNLAERGINSGYDFLDVRAGFDIGEAMIEYTNDDTYGRALLVGILNTIKVAFVGIVLASIVGVIMGIARLSSNWLVAKFASFYVEVMRNIPLLLQLFFWYGVIIATLPRPRDSWTLLPGVFLSNRGLKYPVMAEDPIWIWVLVAMAAGAVGAYLFARWATKRQEETGVRPPVFWPALGIIVGAGAAMWLIGGAPTAINAPELRGFNFRGGATISPEFLALLLGLVIYTGAFIAEIVRSGIQAVNYGQTEAAKAVGLNPNHTLRLVVLPQALRVIIPPVTSQYLNLTKNSSLAIAIGYPDLVAVGNTALNQSGQAIEIISIFMIVYLSLSLLTSVFMNWYNGRIALTER
ncbi:MAG: amino acid ABC transporter permease [Devosiaceae bacterium]|nr:amino acid ABC transporter permease [Devosiaceae bacterium MH13]